ncbi:hypothetical protein ACFWWT_48485 [Streptomyces sp. NPDC058676]|uniref:beta-xylosidase family glycoside hydrolase n=1 Tax=unclassified Streptomyces TaxID=2593676 RepID=UPI0036536D6B
MKPKRESNHNPDHDKWSVNNGLTLRTATATNDLYWARNTLTHRIQGPTSTATIQLDYATIRDGQQLEHHRHRRRSRERQRHGLRRADTRRLRPYRRFALTTPRAQQRSSPASDQLLSPRPAAPGRTTPWPVPPSTGQRLTRPQ